MAETSIEWTDATWNPVAGCTVISAGCANCYAMRMAARLEAMGVEKYRGLTRKSGRRRVWTGKVRCDEAALDAPRNWSRARRIFVNSMSDLFHEDVPFSFVERVRDGEHHGATSGGKLVPERTLLRGGWPCGVGPHRPRGPAPALVEDRPFEPVSVET
jgi:protein gp37